MNNKIYPCVWFNGHTEEAISFYKEVFLDVLVKSENFYGKEGFEFHNQKEGSIMTAKIQILNQDFLFLNGGPFFRPNPSISFYVNLDELEAENVFKKISERGKIMMEFGQYPWAKKYGWVEDEFGISWQISAGNTDDLKNKITPSLLFAKKSEGMGVKALKKYLEIFPNSEKLAEVLYDDGKLKYGKIGFNNQEFILMDSPISHEFGFDEGISLTIDCENQTEIDYFWDNLTKNGEEGQCGWLKDEVGISWQIVPKILGELLKNKEKAGKVTEAFLKMKKFDIETLKNV
jgi:predicted 3-demethylubiquinone-9 3-methyltransferase (glyoxalase superfamily)